jgi:hypothetical protein
MDCPHCHSSSTTERAGRTVHDFRRFRCWQCGRRYNKRTGTALNRVPSDIVFLFWRLRYKLSLRDLAEVFLVRGTVFTHEACGIGKPGWRRCSSRRRPGALVHKSVSAAGWGGYRGCPAVESPHAVQAQRTAPSQNPESQVQGFQLAGV